MGSAGSKAARAAAPAARQYPSRAAQQAPTSRQGPSPTTSQTTPTSAKPAYEEHIEGARPGATVHPVPQAYGTRNEAIDLDARDPQFASRLSELGPVKPYPTYSHSSTVASALQSASSSSSSNNQQTTTNTTPTNIFPHPSANPAVAILTARQRIQDAAERERTDIGKPGFEGRQFLDILTIRKVLDLRDEQGMEAGEIERAMGLKSGMVARLGRSGVVEAA